MPAVIDASLPAGFAVGHWTDRVSWTGCTVVLAPEGSVGACEVRGGGPATRESDVLSPSSATRGANAVLLTGGSAFGLSAADGVVRWLEERGIGFVTRAARVPIVAAAVVYDLGLGSAEVRPTPESGYAACEAASSESPQRGSVGVGTGCTAGKLLGPDAWMKGGFGLASVRVAGGPTVAAVAAVNPLGEVVAEDGSVIAGTRRDGEIVRVSELVERGIPVNRPWREATTLVCVMTDARLGKIEAWLVARAATAGVARAVWPSATSFDGDVTYCLASGAVDAEPFAVSALAAEVTAAAVRDGVREAVGAPGCPAASGR